MPHYIQSVPSNKKLFHGIRVITGFMLAVVFRSITHLPAALLATVSVIILLTGNERLLSVPAELSSASPDAIIIMLKNLLLSAWSLAILLTLVERLYGLHN